MDMNTKAYDRTTQDVGNIVHLEHVNVTQPDQRLATLFYVFALGGTRDPYMMVSVDNMWVNFGRTQMHLPTRDPQRLRGSTGFVVPDLGSLKARLAKAAPMLAGTSFSWSDRGDTVEATCPWGNRFRLHAPSAEFGRSDIGMAYVDFDVPRGAADGIARFYKEIMACPANLITHENSPSADVPVGRSQRLYFTETDAAIPPYDGHHIQVYIADFSSPYRELQERGLITMETDAHEWRFQQIVDPADNRPLFQIEHEVRSLRHPLYARPLVNRNPTQTNRDYMPGQDGFRGVY